MVQGTSVPHLFRTTMFRSTMATEKGGRWRKTGYLFFIFFIPRVSASGKMEHEMRGQKARPSVFESANEIPRDTYTDNFAIMATVSLALNELDGFVETRE